MPQDPFLFFYRQACNYLLYRPVGYRNGKQWPLILFLHGSGERHATDVNQVKRYGLPKLVDTRFDFPYIVVSPQCPPDKRWIDQIDMLEALLEKLMRELPVDLSRIYLTGYSMGGQGAWYWAATKPGKFAAVVPLSARMPPDPRFMDKISQMKHTPVWAFHGAKDPIVPVHHSETIVALLKRSGGDVRLTVYPDGDHFIADHVYDDVALYSWLSNYALYRPA